MALNITLNEVKTKLQGFGISLVNESSIESVYITPMIDEFSFEADYDDMENLQQRVSKSLVLAIIAKSLIAMAAKRGGSNSLVRWDGTDANLLKTAIASLNDEIRRKRILLGFSSKGNNSTCEEVDLMSGVSREWNGY